MRYARQFFLTLVVVVLISIPLNTLTTAGIIQLQNDNGDFYQGSFVGRIEDDIDGAVFIPDPALFPITIQSVEFAFHRPQGADYIGDSAQVRVRIYALQDGEVGEMLAQSGSQTLAGLDVWHSIPLDPPLTLDEPAGFMAAVKWDSGTEDEPAPSLATDSNLGAPQADKDQMNLYHDANAVFAKPPCVTGFCTHSDFWGDPDRVGFNMIRVTIDTPLNPTETPDGAAETTTPTATHTPTGTVVAGATPTATHTPTATGTPADTVTECYDVNGDGQGDLGDVQMMAGCWRDSSPSCLTHDVVSDQIINILDLMRLVIQVPCTPAEPTPTATLTPTPPPSIPSGSDKLTARVFIDFRCNRIFESVDVPLGGVPVTIRFPDGSSETRQTTSSGWVNFFNFDASGGLTVSVDLSAGYRGRLLRSCYNSPASIELDAGNFKYGTKSVQFEAEVLGESAAP